jgi:titin
MIPQTASGCASSTTINTVPVYVCTIQPSSFLPQITGNYITIDGYAGNPGCPSGDSQPCGAQANSKPAFGSGSGDNAVLTIVLSGAGLTSDGIRVSGSNDAVRGLQVTGFSAAYGVGVGGTGDTVSGDFIGTDGVSSLPNAHGIDLTGSGNTIGGTTASDHNVISGNGGGNGIYLAGGSNIIEGNYIGTNAAGSSAMPNDGPTGYGNGIDIATLSTGNHVGEPGAGNLISGDYTQIWMHPGDGNFIQGNYIGVNAAGTGTAAGSNIGAGLYAAGNSSNNLIGGPEPGDGNVVGGDQQGLYIAWGSGNTLQGNLVGTNADGTAAAPNLDSGVIVESAGSPASTANLVGGPTAGDRNIISGNKGDGVDMGGSSANFIEGNYIGTDVTGTSTGTDGKSLGNLYDGVYMYDGSTPSDTQNNIIGGTTAGSGNLIDGNGWYGVSLVALGAGNKVQGNSIGRGVSGVMLGNGRARRGRV